MLEAARQRRQEGVDVVVISVDTHGDPRTEALLTGLEVFPRLQAGYRGAALGEINVDAVLMRHPQLAIVDELAHPNPAGGRHPKRYQDVEELLAAGLDVYATLNIGQLESLSDVATQITGIVMAETVPDRLLDQAYEIQVVDLLPAELLRRLDEGKVHVASLGERAMSQFFRQGNLIALREITLRRTADQLDDQMRAYMATRAIPGPWPARERLLVCISPSPSGECLVRAARRMADSLGAAWSAIYVETPGQGRLSSKDQDTLARTLALAEELGAKAYAVPGSSVVAAILTYATHLCQQPQRHQDHRRQAAAATLARAVAPVGCRSAYSSGRLRRPRG